MELFLDPVLDDPRLDVAGASPPIGVMLNENDIVDESKGMRKKRSDVDWRGRGAGGDRKREREDVCGRAGT